MFYRHLNIASSRLAVLCVSSKHNTATRFLFNTPIPIVRHCRGLSSIASTLPTIVYHKKDIGDLSIRPMTEDDKHGISELVKSRNFVDCSDSDMDSVFQSPQFLGIVASNETNELIGYFGILKQTKAIWSGGHTVTVEKYRRMDIMKDTGRYVKKYCTVGEGATILAYGYESFEKYYNSIGQYFDWSAGKFFRILGEFDKSYLSENMEGDVEIVNIDANNFFQVLCYDEEIHVLPRKPILHAMCFHPSTKAYAAKQDGKITGYALSKKCQQGYKIAPLFADNASIAQILYQKAMNDIPTNSPVSMIMTSNCDNTDVFLKRNNFKVIDTMYRTIWPRNKQYPFSVNFQKVFSLTDCTFSLKFFPK